jgi:hypothetical protein
VAAGRVVATDVAAAGPAGPVDRDDVVVIVGPSATSNGFVDGGTPTGPAACPGWLIIGV